MIWNARFPSVTLSVKVCLPGCLHICTIQSYLF
jgi:hypothetical protein